MKISKEFLQAHPECIFVFGDNLIRRGTGGAAELRFESNTYGFITKKAPSFNPQAYFKPEEYQRVFDDEWKKLIEFIESRPDKTFLISKFGSGLANRYGIWEIIKPRIIELQKYNNVQLLFTT
jgi:hypothetical protein